MHKQKTTIRDGRFTDHEKTPDTQYSHSQMETHKSIRNQYRQSCASKATASPRTPAKMKLPGRDTIVGEKM
jgi:hypothetical protein